jgi:ATP-binding cassette subfamily C (CFTR/MRP) protein 1
MAIGLWALVVFQSICQHQVRQAQRLSTHHQFFFRSMAIGVLVRATLISAVYKRALSLTVEARAAHPNGQLTTLVSSDVSVGKDDSGTDEQISRIDYCAQCKLYVEERLESG